jgi:predicted SnoaL-like aldol condensation-catalyzing enzyme
VLGSGGLATALLAREPRLTGAQDATPAANLEANKTSVRRVFDEGVNTNNPDIVDELYTADFIDHSAFPDQLPGPDGIKQAIADFNVLLPDVHVTVDAIVGAGDLIATRETWRGTDPATGQEVMGLTLHFWGFRDGRIAEEWSCGWEWLEQIAAVSDAPAPGTPAA